MRFCVGCDEDTISLICEECGEETILETTPSISTNSSHSNIDTNNTSPIVENRSIFSFINSDLRAAIDASFLESHPSRAIDKNFLKTMGKVTLDERKSLLYETILTIGPLKLFATLAEFSPIPSNDSLSLKINNFVLGDPCEGDIEFKNKDDIYNSALILRRGKISFAQKALIAQKHGAQILIIQQNFNTWPFIPTDNACELIIAEKKNLNDEKLKIPVICISEKDSELIEQYLIEANTKSKKNTIVNGELNISKGNEDCSICMEDMKQNEEVYRLPCGRHVFHSKCLNGWLSEHNTCPNCRHVMPEEQQKNSVTQRRARALYTHEQMVG